MNQLFNALYKKWEIILILIVSFFLRIWELDFQSMWLDELHTMVEADPALSWKVFFNFFRSYDLHPPLYFIVERMFFFLFGHTSFVARMVSVIAGTISVWAMYCFGKEILSKRLGIIVAVLTSINYYSIIYSQEARGYIFAFLFVVLSFLYFIRLIKHPNRKNALFYTVYTLCLLYSHYYGIFVVVAQAILALIFTFQEKGSERKKLFNLFLLSGVAIAIGYTPWLPFLKSMSEIKSFWISDINDAFVSKFFYDYFGNSNLLKPLLVLFLLMYFFHATLIEKKNEIGKIKNNPLLLSMIIGLCLVFITYIIPYIRSLIVVPMLYPRYTIVTLPVILLALAYGLELFKSSLLRWTLLGVFVSLSITDLFFVKQYYQKISKTQFREMMQFVAKENKDDYLIINELTSSQNDYYMKLFDIKVPVLSDKKEYLVDSILNKSSTQNQPSGFWIVRAHGDGALEEATRKKLKPIYLSLKQISLFGASAELFVLKERHNDNYQRIDFDDFATDKGTVIPNDKVIAIWAGTIRSQLIKLKKGKFNISLFARGSACKNVYPHLNIYCNEEKIGDCFLTSSIEKTTFTYDVPVDMDLTVKIEFDNELSVPGKGDRNAFIESILFERIKE